MKRKGAPRGAPFFLFWTRFSCYARKEMQPGVLSTIACCLFTFVSMGCATQPPHIYDDFVLGSETKRLEGWIAARGEWRLFATRDFENYSPYGKDEEKKCVSLINDTGLQRNKLRRLDGEQVVVTGHAIRYLDLDNGKSVQDRYLPKKYFKEETVFNYCLRDWVFVATSIGKKER